MIRILYFIWEKLKKCYQLLSIVHSQCPDKAHKSDGCYENNIIKGFISMTDY